jgi:pyruvate dehydrogenase E1 component alpha subunit
VNGYRPKDEEKAWKERDPITSLAHALLATGRFTEAELARVDAEVATELDEAVAYAEAAPSATAEQALEGVYA